MSEEVFFLPFQIQKNGRKGTKGSTMDQIDFGCLFPAFRESLGVEPMADLKKFRLGGFLRLQVGRIHGFWRGSDRWVGGISRLIPGGKVQPDNIIPFEQPQSETGFSSIPMKSDLVEKASEIVPDPLVLINMVSKRVRQLNSGRSPLIQARPGMGAADISLTEIIEGKIKLAEPKSAK
jgi:DNA-directed RNA polymerase subunit omega